MAVDNLKNINGTWYVRVAIPAELRAAFGNKTEFLKSLKTGRKSEAMVLRTKDLHEFKSRIASERRRLVVEQEMSSLSLLPSAARFDELFESLEEIKAGLAEQKQERKRDFEESDYEDIHALKKIESHRNFLNHLLLEKQALGEELNPAQAELLNELNEFEKLPNKSFKKAEDLLEKLEKSNVLGSFSGLVNNEEEKEQVKALIAEPAKVVKKHPLNEKNFVEFHKYEVKRKVTLRSIDRHVNRLNMLKDFLDKQKDRKSVV